MATKSKAAPKQQSKKSTTFKQLASKRVERALALLDTLRKQLQRGNFPASPLVDSIAYTVKVKEQVDGIANDFSAPTTRGLGPSLAVGDRVTIHPDALENHVTLFGEPVKGELKVVGVTRGQAALELPNKSRIALSRKFVRKVGADA